MLVPFVSNFIKMFCAWFFSHQTNVVDFSNAATSVATIAFRAFASSSIVALLINSSRQSLVHWFEAAHKIARDDRYLIGEILVNYSPQAEATTSK